MGVTAQGSRGPGLAALLSRGYRRVRARCESPSRNEHPVATRTRCPRPDPRGAALPRRRRCIPPRRLRAPLAAGARSAGRAPATLTASCCRSRPGCPTGTLAGLREPLFRQMHEREQIDTHLAGTRAASRRGSAEHGRSRRANGRRSTRRDCGDRTAADLTVPPDDDAGRAAAATAARVVESIAVIVPNEPRSRRSPDPS